MKYIQKCILLLLLLIPFKVKANTLECPSVATYNEEIACILKIDNITGLKTNYKLAQGLAYQDFIPNEPFKTYYKDSKGITIGEIKTKNNLEAVLKIKIANNIELNKDYIIELNNITISNELYEDVKIENLTSKVKVVSNNNYLKELSIEGLSFKEKFTSLKTTYTATTPRSQINIKAMPEDADAKVEGTGIKQLSYGTNIFIIKVESPYKEVREYKIIITRPIKEKKEPKLDNDATLKSLKVNDEEIKLEDNIFTYTKIVENNIDKLNIEAIPNSTTSTVEIENNDLLEYGENEIIITITAEDKTECKYLLIVTRNQEPSKDNTIKRLEIKNYKLEFNPNILDYNLTIYNEDSLTIKLELNSPLATYEIIGNENLEDDSLIQIKVISESNDERIYTIKIKKDKTKEKLLITLSTALIVLILLALLIFVINKMIKFIKKHKEIN